MDYNTILLIVTLFGIIVISLLLTKKDVNRTSTNLLASFYFIFTVFCLQTYVIETGLLNRFSWFYGWPLILYSLFSAPIYFYFKSIFEDSLKWKWKYVFIFIPFLLSSIDVIILYTKPISFYNKIIQMAVEHSENRFDVSYGFFSLNKHYFIRHLWQLLLLLLIFPKLIRFIKIKTTDKIKSKLDNWLIFLFTSLLILSFILTLFGINEMLEDIPYLDIFSNANFKRNGIFIFYTVILIIGVVPIYFPSILYGYPQARRSKPSSNNQSENLVKIEELKFGLDENHIKQKLKLLEQKELYCSQDFNLTMCAQELEIPAHHLSYFFNRNFGISFITYRNNLRMEKAKRLIKKGFMNKNTVQALALECGFSSRSSFSKKFKLHTGYSITEFVFNNK